MAHPHRRVVGENIRSRRKQLRLSQEQLAEKADLNPKYMSEVERGRVNISLDALARIAKALRVGLRDLVTDT